MSNDADPASILAELSQRYPGRLRHIERLPARAARTGEWPVWLEPVVLSALMGSGIQNPWLHQSQVMDLAHDGSHVVISTGTASGKSLGYLAPVLSDIVSGTAAPTGRGASALYLAPTKALAADQLARVESLLIPGVRAATYDGDTSPDERRWVRDHAHLILSNPDLLHYTLLPGHQHWRGFLRSLRYVIVDECHIYRGVFGSHVASVLRRLRRVAARYGATPTFILASATVSDPADHARKLTGLDVHAITDDTSPREALTFALWEPETTDGRRPAASTEAADVMADLVDRGVQTLAFARSRAGVEALATRTRRILAERAPELSGSVAAYRGGYLPEDRRALERGLREGTVRGLAATNALELGVDISGLDAVVMAGWPGRRASLWQQAGRAGRSGRESLAVLIGADDPLDTFLMSHPKAVFATAIEATVMDPDNRHVLAPHLAAAAAELPLTDADNDLFGPSTPAVLRALVSAGVLRRRPTGWYWAREDRPSDHVSLRGVADPVAIAEARSGRILGTIDAATAHTQVHTGAVHLHQGETYVVTELDLTAASASVVRGDPGWSTMAQTQSSFNIISADRTRTYGPLDVSFGRVSVRTQVTGFLRRLPSGEVIGRHELDLPERHLDTKAVWWTLPPETLELARIPEADAPGALHAAEHAAIGLMPLIASSDRWDIGGVSTALHPDTGRPTIMVYDGYPGGAGFAQRAHDTLRPWLEATAQTIADCACATGCPGCVQSPKCGNGNEPLDKAGALALLETTLSFLPAVGIAGGLLSPSPAPSPSLG